MKTATTVYRELASRLAALRGCSEEWTAKHQEIIDQIMSYAPSGSGIDNGTTFQQEKSTPDKLVFSFSVHHMNGNGFYDGWTEHTMTVRPSLARGYSLTIGGRNRNEIKDYLYEVYSCWIASELVWHEETEKYYPQGYEPEKMIGECGEKALADMRTRGGVWAAYRNVDLSTRQIGSLRFLSVGQGCTFETAPARYPDTQHGTGWQYYYDGLVNLADGTIVKQTANAS